MFAGYIVGNKKFSNTWKAVDYAESVKGHVEFEYYNDVFCNLKGLKVEPHIDYRTPYLKKLFKQEQNLFYSGGSDSQTILDISEKNNLKWQSLVTVLSAPTRDGEANNEYLPGIEYARKNKHNLEIWNHDIRHWEEIYSDPKFMYKKVLCTDKRCFVLTKDVLDIPKIVCMYRRVFERTKNMWYM